MNFFEKLKLLKKNNATEMNYKMLFQNIIKGIYLSVFLIIILICVFFPKIEYANKSLCANFLSPWVLMFLGTIFFAVVYTVANCFNFKNSKKTMIVVSILFFFLNLFCVYNYYFYTGWDSSELINFSNSYIHHQNANDYQWYFSRYPNNLFLAEIFSIIRFVAHNIGFHDYEYFAILTVQCFLNAVTGYLLFHIIKYLFDDTKISLFGYVVYVLLAGISPWISIPYSDSMALIFPTLILYLYIHNKKKNSMLVWFFIGLCSTVGYKIKPQTFIVFIAVILVETFCVAGKRELKKSFLNDLIAIFGAFMGLCIIKVGISAMNFPVDKNMSFGIAHYFMMGMNPADMGNFSDKDVEFSASFSTCAERNAADLYVAINRIKNMHVLGLVQQFARKILSNYYNGTFSWAAEGGFFLEVFPPKATPICEFLCGLYYTGQYGDIGKYYILWSNFEQMIWLTIIFLNVFAWHATKNNRVCVIMLSILGLTLFELIFEARARYLFTYIPLYIILSLYGFQYIRSRLNTFRERYKRSER